MTAFTNRMARLATYLPAAAAALLFVGAWRLTQVEITYLGEGIRTPWVFLAAGIAYCILCVPRFVACLTSDAPERFQRLGMDVLISIGWVCLFTVGGRVLFTFFWPWEPNFGSIVGTIAGMFLLRYVLTPLDSGKFVFHRGTRPVGQAEAQRRADGRTAQTGPSQPVQPIPIRWANLELPESAAEGHLCVVGTPGSGKTLMHRELMAGVLPRIGANPDLRAVVYDVKADLLSHLRALGVKRERIEVFNPFDARAAAWDLAADITDAALARQYADVFISPRKNDHNPFFNDAAQALLSGAIKALLLTVPGQWTLRDLIHVTATGERLRGLLERTPHTRDFISRYFEPQSTFQNIMSSIANALTPLEPIAALWEKTTRKVSLNQWAQRGESVLVLARHFRYADASTAINRVIFKCLSTALLSGPESPRRPRMWFFIDELQEAGRLNGLTSLLNDGRSKGVRCVLGFQDLDGLRDEYGPEQANEIAGKCSNLSVLRVANLATAQWASQRIGQAERFEYMQGTSSSRQGTTQTTSEALTARPSVMPEELMNLPFSEGGHVAGWHIVPMIPAVFRGDAHYPLHAHDETANFTPRANPADQLLAPWTDADATRLGLAPPPVSRPDAPVTTPVQSPLDSIGRFSLNGE